MSEPPAVDLRRDVKSLCAELLAAGGAPEVRMLAVLARVFPAQASARGILDPKLGVYSEGFFLRLIESELSGTAEAGLIVFRSERVEEIRREKGEDVAAQVLGRLAEFLRPRQAVAEWLGRVGPDSLGLLLPQVGILTAQERAQTLYEALRRSSRFPTSAGVSHTMDLSGGAPELVRLAREAAQATRDSGGRQPRTLTSRGPVAPPVATAPPAAAAPAGPTLAARYQRLVLLNRMSLELFADQPFSEALLQACSTILALTQANYAAVHFCDEFGQPFCAVRHGEGPAARTEGHAEEARLVARVLAERRILSAGGSRGWSAAPLLQNRPDGPAPLGAVVVGFPESRPPDPELEQTLLEISRLLRNARLTQQHLEHQQVLGAVTDQSADAIYITGQDSRIVSWNAAAEQLFGYSPAEAIGRAADFLVPPERMAELEVKDAQALAEGRVKNFETVRLRKDGSPVPVEATFFLLRDEKARPFGTVRVFRDITERKVMEKALVDARDAAQQAERAKAEFLANMSHEIRTPMNAIIGMTGLLLDTGLDATQREYATVVKNGGEGLLEIINEILDFSKIGAGRMSIEVVDFDLREAVEGVVELVAPRAAEKGIELASSVEPEVPVFLRGDAGRIRQILLNLLANAVKFTERGEVVLRVARAEESGARTSIRFEVRDSGIGISPEGQRVIFQSFTQADASTTRKYGGTGLGLTISKKLVELMGGTIGVQSEPGRGSTFFFCLPLEVQPEPAPAPERKDLEGVRALVVDDNAANREIVRRQLVSWKMEAEAAAGGAEALAKLRQAAAQARPYQVALVDQRMPQMDGLALARAVRGDPALAGVRLVLMSPLGRASTAEELGAAGFWQCLVKPVRQAALYDGLLRALGKAAPAASGPRRGGPVQGTAARRFFRVLVAEDNAVNQKVAVRQLHRLGYEADVAADGIEALEALKRIPYDLVFMDCQMPEMDGFQATAEIRKGEGGRKHTPVIAMTASALEGDREKCLAAGMDDYISKPVRIEDLEKVLGRWDMAVDAAALAALRELGGAEDPGYLDGLIRDFLEEAAKRLAALRGAVESGDAKALELAAHALKGSSGNMGVRRMQRLCLHLEAIGKSGAVARAAGLMAALEGEWVLAQAALEAEQTRRKSG